MQEIYLPPYKSCRSFGGKKTFVKPIIWGDSLRVSLQNTVSTANISQNLDFISLFTVFSIGSEISLSVPHMTLLLLGS